MGSQRVGHDWVTLTFIFREHFSLWLLLFMFSRVRLCLTKSCPTLCDLAARQVSLSFTIPGSLLKLMSIESVIPSNHLVLCCPLLLLPSIFPSIKIFSYESALLIRWPKYWSFSLSISPSNEYSGLISFKMDWLDLDAVQGTLKSLLQHHSSKASIVSAQLHNNFMWLPSIHPSETGGWKNFYLALWDYSGLSFNYPLKFNNYVYRKDNVLLNSQ